MGTQIIAFWMWRIFLEVGIPQAHLFPTHQGKSLVSISCLAPAALVSSKILKLGCVSGSSSVKYKHKTVSLVASQHFVFSVCRRQFGNRQSHLSADKMDIAAATDNGLWTFCHSKWSFVLWSYWYPVPTEAPHSLTQRHKNLNVQLVRHQCTYNFYKAKAKKTDLCAKLV